MGTDQITAGSNYVRSMVQQLCEFQQAALDSPEDVLDTMVHEREGRGICTLEGGIA
jgi:hypothetical protein